VDKALFAGNRRVDPQVTVIEPRRGLRGIGLAELWRYREVLFFLVWRDFKVRYRQTALGVAWALLQPVLTAAVLTMLFSHMAQVPSDGVPYPLFVIAGLTAWQFFAHGVSTATMSMANNQDLVRRIYFPRLAIPLAAVLSGLIDLLVCLCLVFAALVIYGHPLAPSLFLLPLFLLLAVAATMGVGLILCAANVRYRDIGHATPFVLQIALFLSPIAYSSNALPEHWRLLYSLNPMVGVVDGLRWCFFGAPIDPAGLMVSIGATIGTLAVGALYFRSTERVLADIL
jgi:lipopolysaccharide transport system permease protein